MSKRNKILLSDDDEEEEEVKIIEKPKKVIKIEDDEEEEENDGYFNAVEIIPAPVNSSNSSGSKTNGHYETRQSSRRQALSNKKELQRKEAEKELKRLYNQGLNAVLEEESEEEEGGTEVSYKEEEDDDEEEEYQEEEEDEPNHRSSSKSKKKEGKRALEAFNDRAFSKKPNYSNATVARCLKDYEKEEITNDYDSDLDDFIVDEDEEEEEEEEVVKPPPRKSKKKAKPSKKSKKSKIPESESDLEGSEKKDADGEKDNDDEENVLIKKKTKRVRKRKTNLSSDEENEDQKGNSDDDEEDGDEEDEEDEEESVDGNLLYWRFNQMRDSQEQEGGETLLGIRKSFPVPEAIGYYIEYLGKSLISKTATKELAKSSNYASAARQIENLICTHRESLLGSSAWRADFLKELQSRPFYLSKKTGERYFHDCYYSQGNEEKCAACGRGSQEADHRVSLFGPSYSASRIWEAHWIDHIPKALLLHTSETMVNSSSSNPPKTPNSGKNSATSPMKSPATGITTSSTATGRSNNSRGQRQYQIFQSSLLPPNSNAKRKLSLTPTTGNGRSNLIPPSSIAGRLDAAYGIASLHKPEVNRSPPKLPTPSPKKRNAIILTDSEDEDESVAKQQNAPPSIDLTAEDNLTFVREENRPFPSSERVDLTQEDGKNNSDNQEQDSASEDGNQNNSSGGETDSDNDKRKSFSKPKNRDKRIEWWEKKLSKQLNFEEESTWYLSLHCKYRTQLYHTLMHYKFRLLLKIYEYFETMNEVNCELSELSAEELQQLYEAMIVDNGFIQREVDRFQTLIRTTVRRWGGDKFEAQGDVWKNDEQIYQRREKMTGKKRKQSSKDNEEEGDDDSLGEGKGRSNDNGNDIDNEEEEQEKVTKGGKGQLSFKRQKVHQPKYQTSLTDWVARK